MITEDGKLFHIDFGFVFGREPNSLKERLSSKIRINKEMVKPMGGIKGANFTKFEDKFVESFLYLRNKVSYLMNLLYLMINAELTDLSNHDHLRILSELYERFMPELDNQETTQQLKDLLQECIESRGVEVLEDFHKYANYLK